MGGMGYDEVGLGVRIGEGFYEVCGLICVCDGCV